MKKITYFLLLLFFTAQISAHCGGCGPKESSSDYSSKADNAECVSCKDKSTKLNLTKKDKQRCDAIMTEYKIELAKLKSKYVEKIDQVLSDEELELYLELNELTKI
tara:strand:+ start:3133 stop:3450 length:318 start_codon:yes stop_codon:yes gene_type:complete